MPSGYYSRHCTCQPKIILFHPQSGKEFRPDCGGWRCPFCARRKAKRLAARAVAAFQEEKFLTMWTLTLTSSIELSDTLNSGSDAPLRSGWEDVQAKIKMHHEVLMGAWRRLIQKIKGGKLKWILGERFRYLLVKEQHKSGFVHLHILVNQYAHWARLQDVWEMCVRAEMRAKGVVLAFPTKKFCNANIAKGNGGKVGSRMIAAYICKYLMKQRTASNRRGLPPWRRSWSGTRGSVSLATGKKGETGWKCLTLKKRNVEMSRLILVNHRLNVSGEEIVQPRVWFPGVGLYVPKTMVDECGILAADSAASWRRKWNVTFGETVGGAEDGM